MGFSAGDITIMIEAVLSCNVFRFENKLFEQIRGLSMGNRIAPLLAIIFLDQIEKMSLTSGILLYKRYIDDVFVVGTTGMEVEATLDRLNAFDQHVSYTIERPDDEGYLPFLNTKVRIVRGQKEHVWYKKAASANILVHARSAHPHFIKANVVRNLIRTKDKLCTTKDLEVEKTISRILEENGYNGNPTTTWLPHATLDGLPLILPYVGEHPARAVNEVVKRSGLPIRLVFRPPPTLKHLLTSTRIYEDKCPEVDCQYCTKEEKICQLRGTVYLIRCEGASRSFLVVSIAFPVFLAGLAILGYELYSKAQNERNELVQRLVRDVKEIGLLAIFPGTAVLVVAVVLLRLHQLRILRIYQNRKSVDDYLAIGSKRIIEKHQIPFHRDVASACYFSDEKTDFARMLTQVLIGNMQIENKRFLIDDDGFRANNYRSYMLNETSTPPRL
ncbi:hypothetical protein Y032_0075g972 [Ancylostoma ceylanicum]|uniref:Reverse transcriptase domain-containing protein n=1 Tax=Ancylostoma ceylanicum TaxID=53326 RepID=A0A016TUB2_9BILA|nr:hypothetical protein Y032_0075g972 [Ancylostoma ceylanicum]